MHARRGRGHEWTCEHEASLVKIIDESGPPPNQQVTSEYWINFARSWNEANPTGPYRTADALLQKRKKMVQKWEQYLGGPREPTLMLAGKDDADAKADADARAPNSPRQEKAIWAADLSNQMLHALHRDKVPSKVLFVGDSVSYRLAQFVEIKIGKPHVINKAKNQTNAKECRSQISANTGDWYEDIKSQLCVTSLLVVGTGTNDRFGYRPGNAIFSDLKPLLENLQKHAPKELRTVFVTPTPKSDFDDSDDTFSTEFNKTVRDQDRDRFFCVSRSDVGLENDDFIDGLHPDDSGFEKIMKAIIKKLPTPALQIQAPTAGSSSDTETLEALISSRTPKVSAEDLSRANQEADDTKTKYKKVCDAEEKMKKQITAEVQEDQRKLFEQKVLEISVDFTTGKPQWRTGPGSPIDPPPIRPASKRKLEGIQGERKSLLRKSQENEEKVSKVKQDIEKAKKIQDAHNQLLLVLE